MGDEMARKIIRYQHIRDLREDADLSQADVAKILNCSQVAYSYYEIGNRDIPTDYLIMLAKFYKCSTDYLLGLTNIKKPYPKI
jgi:Predicted transcriptional regulators